MATRGIEMALQNFGIVIPELVPGTLNAGKTPVIQTDAEGSGNDLTPLQTWARHQPEGLHGATGHSLTQDMADIAPPWRPQYGLLDLRMREVFGNPFLSDILADGRRRNLYRLPERGKAPAIETYSMFYGVDDDAIEGRYCFTKAMGMVHTRASDTSGTRDVRINRIKTRSIAMPGSVAQTEQQHLVATNALGAATVNHGLGGAGTFAVTPGDTAAAVQIAARAGGETGVTVAGSSTAAVAATQEVQTITLASVPTGPIYITAAGTATSFEAADTAVQLQTVLEAIYGVGNVSVTSSVALSSAGIYSGVFTITFAGSLGNVAQITTLTAGVTCATTTPGVAATLGAVDFTFTFAGQPNTNVAQMTVTGTYAAQYTVTTLVDGNDGSGPIEVDTAYLEADHWLVYKSSDYADLQAIDWTNVPSDTSDGDIHLITTAEGAMFSLADMADSHFVEDGKKFPANHRGGAMTVTASVTLAKDSAGRCEEIYATENGCAATPFYLSQRARCGDWEFRFHSFNSRNAQPGVPVNNGVAQREFPLERIVNQADYAAGWGSCVVEVIRPASQTVEMA